VNNPPKKPPLSSHLSDTQWRPRAARIRYDEIESAFGEEGLGDPALVYEEEKDLFRFAADGVFAFPLASTPTGESSGGGGCGQSSRPVRIFIALAPGPMTYASHEGEGLGFCVSSHRHVCYLSLELFSKVLYTQVAHSEEGRGLDGLPVFSCSCGWGLAFTFLNSILSYS
jgi:hypothetical protein